MLLLTIISLIVWVLVGIVPLDQRARVGIGVTIIVVLILGLLGVIHLPAQAGRY